MGVSLFPFGENLFGQVVARRPARSGATGQNDLDVVQQRQPFSLGQPDQAPRNAASGQGRDGQARVHHAEQAEKARAFVRHAKFDVFALQGADLLLYPSAIGSEPTRSELDTQKPWQRVMQGHAVANTIPLAACNRVGDEGRQLFYGTSFIADGRGEILTQLGREGEGVAVAELDLGAWRKERDWFGLLRDRRPELYGKLIER